MIFHHQQAHSETDIHIHNVHNVYVHTHAFMDAKLNINVLKSIGPSFLCVSVCKCVSIVRKIESSKCFYLFKEYLSIQYNIYKIQ